MKALLKLLLLAFFISGFQTVKAQNRQFLPNQIGSEWYYEDITGGEHHIQWGFQHFVQQPDTIIQGKVCKNLKMMNFDSTWFPIYRNLFFYDSSSVIYRWLEVKKKFAVFININDTNSSFDLELDKSKSNWKLSFTETKLHLYDRKVDSILIDSTYLKTYGYKYIVQGYDTITVTFIEKLISIRHLVPEMIPIEQKESWVTYENIGFKHLYLRCFNDSYINYKHTAVTKCDTVNLKYTSNTSEIGSPLEGIKIVPNPAQQQLIVQFNTLQSGSVVVYSSLGVKVYEQTVKEQEQVILQIAHLPNGVYYLSVTGNSIFVNKPFIKN